MEFSHLPNELTDILLLLKKHKQGLNEQSIELLLEETTNKLLSLQSPARELKILLDFGYITCKNNLYILTVEGKIYLTNLDRELAKINQGEKTVNLAQEANTIAKDSNTIANKANAIAKDSNKIAEKARRDARFSILIAFLSVVVAVIALFKK